MGVLYQKRLSYRNGQNKQPDPPLPSTPSDVQVLNFSTASDNKQGWNYKRTGRVAPIHVGYYAKSDDPYSTFSKCYPSSKEVCNYCQEYLDQQAVQMDQDKYHMECLDQYIVSKILKETEAAAATSDMPNEDIPSRDALMKTISKCYGCQKEIKDYHGVFAIEKLWHLSCFKCHDCNKVLRKDYARRNGQPYCSDDYRRLFGVFCAGCRNYIDGEFLEIGEYNFHSKCATCAECKKTFPDDTEAIVINDKVWHKLCQVIEDGEVKRQTVTRAEVSPKLESVRGTSVSKLRHSNLVQLRCSSMERLQDIGRRGRSISESDALDSWANQNRCRSVTINGRTMLGNRDGSQSPSSPTSIRQRAYDISKRISDPISSTSLVSAIATPPSRRRPHMRITSSSSGDATYNTTISSSPPLRSSPVTTRKTNQIHITKSSTPPIQSSPLTHRKTSETVTSKPVHIQNPGKPRRGVSVPAIGRPNVTTVLRQGSNHSTSSKPIGI